MTEIAQGPKCNSESDIQAKREELLKEKELLIAREDFVGLQKNKEQLDALGGGGDAQVCMDVRHRTAPRLSEIIFIYFFLRREKS